MSARKRMSLRAIARMKRENRELKARLACAKVVGESRTLTRWSEPAQRVRDEIRTAGRLGFVIEATADDTSMTFTAVKRVSA